MTGISEQVGDRACSVLAASHDCAVRARARSVMPVHMLRSVLAHLWRHRADDPTFDAVSGFGLWTPRVLQAVASETSGALSEVRRPGFDASVFGLLGEAVQVAGATVMPVHLLFVLVSRDEVTRWVLSDAGVDVDGLEVALLDAVTAPPARSV